MIYTPDREAVEQARVGFLRKWKLRCKAVSASFEEAGDALFTFTAFPASQWKALQTTNALERIKDQRRVSPGRTRTQASLPSEEAVLFLLFGLLRSGLVPCAAWSGGRRPWPIVTRAPRQHSHWIINRSLVKCRLNEVTSD
jgi:putative transposase